MQSVRQAPSVARTSVTPAAKDDADCKSCEVEFENGFHWIKTPCPDPPGCYCPVPEPFETPFSCSNPRNVGEEPDGTQFYVCLDCDATATVPKTRVLFHAPDDTQTTSFKVPEPGTGGFRWEIFANYDDSRTPQSVPVVMNPVDPDGWATLYVDGGTLPIGFEDGSPRFFQFGKWEITLVRHLP